MSLLGTWPGGKKRGKRQTRVLFTDPVEFKTNTRTPRRGVAEKEGLEGESEPRARWGSCQGHRCADPGPSTRPRVRMGLSTEQERRWVPTRPHQGWGFPLAGFETRRRRRFPAGGRQKAGPPSGKPSLRPPCPTVESSTDGQSSLLSRVGVDGHDLQICRLA